VLALAVPAAVRAQVYKCVDGKGNVTYQQEPCAGGQQGRALEIKQAPAAPAAPDLTPQWAEAAAEGRVITGMPKRFVVQALGQPGERRPPRAGESGGEVWVYVKGDGATRVGFVGDVVAWTTHDAAKPAEGAPRADARNRVSAGRACDEVLAELGPADRQEPVRDVDPATGQARGLDGTRYVFEPGPADGRIRLTFTCFGNQVVDVARALDARGRNQGPARDATASSPR